MEMITGPGLVLRRERHLDHDVKLTIFLRAHGKVTAISKGGLRLSSKLKAIQEPFSEIDFQLYLPPHRPYGRVIGGKLHSSNPHLRGSFEIFQTACRISETVEMILPARAPSPDVYDILAKSFQALQQLTSFPQSLHSEWIRFVAKLLALLGHGDHRELVERMLEKSEIKKATVFAEGQLEPHLPRRLKSFTEVC